MQGVRHLVYHFGAGGSMKTIPPPVLRNDPDNGRMKAAGGKPGPFPPPCLGVCFFFWGVRREAARCTFSRLVWPLDEGPPRALLGPRPHKIFIKLRHQGGARKTERSFMLEWAGAGRPGYRLSAVGKGYNPHRVFRALDVYLQTGKPVQFVSFGGGIFQFA